MALRVAKLRQKPNSPGSRRQGVKPERPGCRQGKYTRFPPRAAEEEKGKGMKRTLLVILLLVLCAYVWANRTGRYAVTRFDQFHFIVIDTSNGEHWVYQAHARDQQPEERIRWREVDHAQPFRFVDRLK